MHHRPRQHQRPSVASLAVYAMAILLLLISHPARALELQALRLPGDLPAIAAVGDIGRGDAELMRRMLRASPRPGSTILLLNSEGGDVTEAKDLAALVRSQGLAVGVAGGNTCANACVLVFLAAARRFAGEGAQIGMAAPIEAGRAEDIQQALQLLAIEHRLPLTVAERFRAFNGVQPVWLNVDELQRIGASMVPTRDNSKPDRSATQDGPAPAGPGPTAGAERLSTARDAAPESADSHAMGAAATAFVANYMAAWSADNQTALAYVQTAYAERVRLYGALITSAAVWSLKGAFAERWPIRHFVVRPDTLAAMCDAAAHHCEVTATIDWTCRSPDRGAVSTGVSTMDLVLRMVDGRLLIEAESGRLLHREVSQAGHTPDATSHGVAVGEANSFLFDQGLSDRRAWEEWLNSLNGDYREGASYWSGQRSLPHPGSCYGSAGSNLGEWTAGCLAAQQRLALPDTRRRTEADYRRGWNSY